MCVSLYVRRRAYVPASRQLYLLNATNRINLYIYILGSLRLACTSGRCLFIINCVFFVVGLFIKELNIKGKGTLNRGMKKYSN